jgi:hypothetical protein
MTKIQSTGEKFNLELYLQGQERTKNLVRDLAKKIHVGMSEKDATNILEDDLRKMGCERCWHPHKIRFGKNTLKSFSEKSDESIRLQTNDVFFIDIGPNWNQHETDYGESFTVGDNPELLKLTSTCQELFYVTQKKWQTSKMTGIELYHFLKAETEKRSYVLNMNSDGHRLGDFPHALFFKGSLAEIEEFPLPHVWILEVHIMNKNMSLGAFFEDIL